MRSRRLVLVLALALPCSALPAAAQDAPARSLGAPTAEFARPFTRVASVRELRDGRVLVLDAQERLIHLIDFRTGAAERVGRHGRGPGEYEWPDYLLPLPGDSTLIFDGASGRLVLITPEGKSSAIPSRWGLTAGDSRFLPKASDARGGLYNDAPPIRRFTDGRPPEYTDSAAIQRWDRVRGRRDTVAYVPRRRPSGRATAGAAAAAAQQPVFPAFDQWAVAPDGWITNVQHDPYRVEFIRPDGSRVSGPPIPYERVRVTDAVKAWWRAEQQKPRLTLVVNRGASSFSMRPGRFEEPDEWPEFLPPFLYGDVSVAPDGRVWVARMTVLDAAPVYDVIDRTGRVAFRVTLAKRAQVVGFGNGTLYVARMDEDDLQYLQRYGIP